MRLLLVTVIVLIVAAAPGYRLVRKDILPARKHLSFAMMESNGAAAQRGSLYAAVKMIRGGAMPLPSFLALHPDANTSPADAAELKLLARAECSLQSLPAGTMNESQESAAKDGKRSAWR